ncbi:MAG TPA: class I SAM-dependent methyltransferase [Thermoanaerobaculia bacterium]|nr:class I SAM-dependent methyltransferase [Thermoanaerobaculia bacterium]
MTQSGKPVWDESDSREFLDLGRFFVPEREEQIEAFCSLIPEPAGACHVVELCCGEGLLARALLERFPPATVHGYDGSEAMLARARGRLGEFGERFAARAFDLGDVSWRRFPWPVHAFVSSLAIHHLDGEGKRGLFRDLYGALAPGGVLLIADLVLPASAAAKELAARSWDEAVRRRSLELAGHLGPYETFRRERWNFYADPEPDPADRPSSLLDQLRWLEEAGFSGVDVFWMKAGHALFGGTRRANGHE